LIWADLPLWTLPVLWNRSEEGNLLSAISNCFSDIVTAIMPSTGNQYADLPLIPQSLDELNYPAWGTGGFNQILPHRFQHGNGSYEDDIHYGDCYDNGMVMNRFMQDPYPVTQGALHVNAPVQRSLEQHYGMQWPVTDYGRNISPSPSGNSSGPTTSEHCSPHAYYATPYTIAEEFNSFSYSTAEHFHDDGYMSQPPHAGGCSLKELEYTQLESERVVEDNNEVDIHEDTPADHESVIVTKIDSSSDVLLGYADSGIGNSVRGAESVERALTPQDDDPASDLDYSPGSDKSLKRKRSSSTGSSNKPNKRRGPGRNDSTASSSTSTGKATKKPRASTNNTKTRADNNDPKRHFPCPFATYGCNSTFSSKNEWKRHVGTQHIKLTFYRCDLCEPTADTKDDHVIWYNDFNRKDLFTQHLRRMHSAEKDAKSHNHKEYPVNEDNICEVQARCLLQLRKAPRHSSCLFCDKTFNGPTSWEDRMEHVGRHLEKDKNSLAGMLDVSTWRRDSELERYLLEENLIVRESGEWRISDGKKTQQVNDTSDSEEE